MSTQARGPEGGEYRFVWFSPARGGAQRPEALRARAAREAFEEAAEKAGRWPFALYAPDGALVRLGAASPEPLSDSSDVTAIAMDDAGVFVATGHADGDVCVWSVASGEPVFRRAAVDGPVHGLRFAEGAGGLLAWNQLGPAVLLDRASGAPLATLDVRADAPFALSVAGDGRELALVSERVERYGLPHGAALVSLEGAHEGGYEPLWVAYAGDDRVVGVLAAGEDTAGDGLDEVRLWSREAGRALRTLGRVAGVCACDASADGAFAAVAHEHDEGAGALAVTVFPLRDEREPAEHRFDAPARALVDLRFDASGERLCVCVAGLGVYLLDARTGRELAHVAEEPATETLLVPVATAVVPDEDETPGLLVTRGLAGGLELLALTPIAPFGPAGRALARDGVRYAAVPHEADNNYLAVYDLAQRRVLATLAHRANALDACLSEDGTRVLTRAAGHAYLWHLPHAAPRL